MIDFYSCFRLYFFVLYIFYFFSANKKGPHCKPLFLFFLLINKRQTKYIYFFIYKKIYKNNKNNSFLSLSLKITTNSSRSCLSAKFNPHMLTITHKFLHNLPVNTILITLTTYQPTYLLLAYYNNIHYTR